MTYLFSPGNSATLSRFLASRVLLAFDFDGTLAPIVPDRAAARMRRRTHSLLLKVCPLFPCAVISGRQQDDIAARLEGLPVRHVVGNHGLELTQATAELATQMTTVRRHLETLLAGREGVEIEDKTFCIAVHYRRAKNRRRARGDIEDALSRLEGDFRVIGGKLVFDVVHATSPNKADALARLRAAEGVDAAIYVGDDATDEDVFRRADPERLLPVRIGRSQHSAAPYFMRDQRELDVFLARVTRGLAQRIQ